MSRHSPKPEWDYQQTKEKILSIKREECKTFSILCYATGARLNEILSLRPNDIKYRKNAYEITLLTSKHYKKTKGGKMSGEKWETRTIPLIIKNEKEYAQKINEFIKKSEKNVFFREYLGGISDRSIQNWLRKELDIHPHNFRHLRARHLSKKSVPGQREFNAFELKYYFGWKKLETAEYYLQAANTEDIRGKME